MDYCNIRNVQLHKYKATQVIQSNPKTIICKGIEEETSRSVIIKTPIKTNLTEHELNRFRSEFELGQQIKSEFVVRYLEIQTYGQSIALILEDDNYICLSSALPRNGFNPITFLHIAIQLVKGLSDIHQNNVIHKDIKTSNIIINPATNQVKYIDFGSATRLKQILETPINPFKTEATLAYISPEQTGRINRPIDYRTDFYSLGVTFYELLTGQLPFPDKHSLELVHCQLAKVPLQPHIIQEGIPVPLSDIVMKLMAKNAEDRYQSCRGILDDLTICLNQIQKGFVQPFPLAQTDYSENLLLAQKLYGREQAVERLLQAYSRAAAGPPEIVAVSGFSGVGKTSLVNELQKPITLSSGYFITGKYDILNRNIAYSAVIQALQMLVKQLLSEGHERIDLWKQKILLALSNKGSLVSELIPELEIIIGKQDPLPPLAATEAEARFNGVMQKFLEVFCNVEHPLVLFLDDMQWADNASLNFVQYFFQNSSAQHFLFVCAYRDNEVSDNHPLIKVLQTVQNLNRKVVNLQVLPLDLEHTNQWISDSFRLPPETTIPLSEVVYQKTAGNPFFVKLFLQHMYDERLLSFRLDTGWKWNLEEIKKQRTTDNVVHLLLKKMAQIPPSTVDILCTASCLGNHFHITTLMTVCKQSRETLDSVLESAFNANLLLQIGDYYHFTHDQVQETCYRSISDNVKLEKHYHIAKLLLEWRPKPLSQEHLFEIVDHFNKAKQLVEKPTERLEVAKLNLEAAHRAKTSIAYGIALDYIKKALEFVQDLDLWKTNYPMAFQLTRSWAEISHLNGDFSAAKDIIAQAEKHLTSNLEKSELYQLLIIQHSMQGELSEAIDLARKSLRLFNIELPDKDLHEESERQFSNIRQALSSVKVDSLLDRPVIQDPEKRAVLTILFNLYIVGYLGFPELLPLVIIMLTDYSLKYGHAPESCMGYAAYGMLLCSQTTDYHLAYEFAELAIKLSDKFHDLVQKCRSYNLIVNCIHNWTKPLASVNPLIEEGIKAGIQAGELQYTGYLYQCKARSLLDQGTPLGKLSMEIADMLQFSKSTKNQIAVDLIFGTQLIVENLAGRTPSPESFQLENVTSEEYEKQLVLTKSYSAIAMYYILKSRVLYLNDLLEEAIKYCNMGKDYLAFIPGQFTLINFTFYQSLQLAAYYSKASVEQKIDFKQTIEKNLQKLSEWKSNCPENVHHKYFLVEAELARITKQPLEMIAQLYNLAITSALTNKFIHEHALANELAGKFWLSQDQPTAAQGFLYQAYASYRKVQYKRKEENILKNYSQLMEPYFSHTSSGFAINSTLTLASSSLKSLDLISILQASLTISTEIDLPKLLDKMMKVIVENAGAQKGSIFLSDDDNFFLEAEYKLSGTINTLQHLSIDEWKNGSRGIVDYVKQTMKPFVTGRASADSVFGKENYVILNRIQSVLCIPIMLQRKLKGILYVENNLVSDAFPQERFEVLLILSMQMAISLENSQLVKRQLEEQHQRLQDAEIYKKRQEEFLDTICHEIRNPLNGIYGGVSFIKEEIAALEEIVSLGSSETVQTQLRDGLLKIKKDLVGVDMCAKQQKLVVDDALDLSKLEKDTVEIISAPMNPSSVIHSVLQMHQPQIIQKNLKLTLESSGVDCFVCGDSQRLSQVVTNILSNAIKFTATGEISIQATMKPSSKPDRKQLCVSISDTGIGMSEDEVVKIFDRFSQANRFISSEYGGSGLGLAISKKLVEKMGGQITVSSQKGKGTQIQFWVECAVLTPQHHEYLTVESQKKPVKPTSSPIDASKTILIVEDNPVNQMLLIRYLQKGGFQRYIAANNGKEAVDICSKRKFDIIFMDIEMPVMNGLEATQKIRELESVSGWNTPIIGLSADARKEKIEEALSVGMDDFLTKPYTAKNLYAKIDQHMTEKQVLKKQKTNHNHNPQLLFHDSDEFKSMTAELKQQNISFMVQLDGTKVVIQGTGELSRYLLNLVMQDLKKHLDRVLGETYGVQWTTSLVGCDLTVNLESSHYASDLVRWLNQVIGK